MARAVGRPDLDRLAAPVRPRARARRRMAGEPLRSIAITGSPRTIRSPRIPSSVVDLPAPLAPTISPCAASWRSLSSTSRPRSSIPSETAGPSAARAPARGAARRGSAREADRRPSPPNRRSARRRPTEREPEQHREGDQRPVRRPSRRGGTGHRVTSGVATADRQPSRGTSGSSPAGWGGAGHLHAHQRREPGLRGRALDRLPERSVADEVQDHVDPRVERVAARGSPRAGRATSASARARPRPDGRCCTAAADPGNAVARLRAGRLPAAVCPTAAASRSMRPSCERICRSEMTASSPPKAPRCAASQSQPRPTSCSYSERLTARGAGRWLPIARRPRRSIR